MQTLNGLLKLRSSTIYQITQLPNLIIGGDFDGKSTAWYENNIINTSGTRIKHGLQHLSILNDLKEYTHMPQQARRNISSPDITCCTSTLTIATLWSSAKKLSSDHLPIIIKTNTKIKIRRENFYKLQKGKLVSLHRRHRKPL